MPSFRSVLIAASVAAVATAIPQGSSAESSSAVASVTPITVSNPATQFLTQTNSDGVITGMPTVNTQMPTVDTRQPDVATVPAGLTVIGGTTFTVSQALPTGTPSSGSTSGAASGSSSGTASGTASGSTDSASESGSSGTATESDSSSTGRATGTGTSGNNSTATDGAPDGEGAASSLGFSAVAAALIAVVGFAVAL